MADAHQQFKLEEFKQLHEHIRNFETAQSTCFTISLVACTTLLTATSAWFFEMYRTEPNKITAALCYPFLSPAFLSVLTLALISSYKTSIYRNGYYIKVFFEEAGEGARWHINLVEFRKLAHSTHVEYRKLASAEHGKPAALVLWALHGISIGLFTLGLLLASHPCPLHFALPLPFVIAMILQHEAFLSNREKIEDAWRLIRTQMPVTLPSEQLSEKSAPPPC